MSLNPDDLRLRLQDLLVTHDVPGAAVAVLADGRVVDTAAGVLNRETRVEVTPDSIFQIGSITKVYTAALVMRFAQRGVLELDTRVQDLLPELRLPDHDAMRSITFRHLLTHTSGIDGDHFFDTGRGDDALERYVASCAELPLQFPAGATMSYCNTGYSIVGRALEVITGKVWDGVLRDELIGPLGLERTFTLPEEVMRFRVAHGHLGDPGDLRLAPAWGMARSIGPAGLINATAGDVVRMARAFLGERDNKPRQQWLSPDAVAEMREPQVAVPDPHGHGTHWGVGWILHQGVGSRLVHGHDGGTLGQAAYLRVVPDAGVAVSLLTNGGASADLAHTLLPEVLAETASVRLRPRVEPKPGASGGDRSRQIGTYARAASTTVVEESGESGLRMTVTSSSYLADVLGAEPAAYELFPVRPDLYAYRVPGHTGWTSVAFYDVPGSTAGRFMHSGARASARTNGTRT